MQPLAPQGYGSPNPYPAQQPPQQQQQFRMDGAGEVSERTVQLMYQTRPWVLFLSVLMFIGSAFMVLGGLAMFGMSAVAGSGSSGLGMGMMGLMYLPFAALYVYPAKKLWGYGSAIGRMTTSRSTTDLEAALGEQKSFWKFLGIMTIVMFAIYIVFFIGLAVFGAAAAAMAH